VLEKTGEGIWHGVQGKQKDGGYYKLKIAEGGSEHEESGSNYRAGF
jgi:hypothetical protein